MTILNKYWKTIIENYFLFLSNISIKTKELTPIPYVNQLKSI
jgi:hypothetical protein